MKHRLVGNTSLEKVRVANGTEGKVRLMKIEDKRPIEVGFDEIPVGGVFEYKGELYMAMCHSSEDKYNAVYLKNGVPCSFDYDDEVMSVRAKVVIE